MDVEKEKGGNWSWLPARMPGVARLLHERRARDGKAWIDECWRRGVVQLEAGWFFAREGPLAVGVPFDPMLNPEAANFGAMAIRNGQSMLLTKAREVSHAAV